MYKLWTGLTLAISFALPCHGNAYLRARGNAYAVHKDTGEITGTPSTQLHYGTGSDGFTSISAYATYGRVIAAIDGGSGFHGRQEGAIESKTVDSLRFTTAGAADGESTTWLIHYRYVKKAAWYRYTQNNRQYAELNIADQQFRFGDSYWVDRFEEDTVPVSVPNNTWVDLSSIAYSEVVWDVGEYRNSTSLTFSFEPNAALGQRLESKSGSQYHSLVPEPSTGLLMSVAAASLFSIRRRSH